MMILEDCQQALSVNQDASIASRATCLPLNKAPLIDG
jgi:hypothetical protein